MADCTRQLYDGLTPIIAAACCLSEVWLVARAAYHLSLVSAVHAPPESGYTLANGSTFPPGAGNDKRERRI